MCRIIVVLLEFKRFFENIGFSDCKGIGAGSITKNMNVKDFQKILGEFTKNMNV